MILTVPSLGSVPATVRGIRSPSSSTRKMMNCPGSALLATRGARISICVTVGFSSFFLTILYMTRSFVLLIYHKCIMFSYACLKQQAHSRNHNQLPQIPGVEEIAGARFSQAPIIEKNK